MSFTKSDKDWQVVQMTKSIAGSGYISKDIFE